MADMADLVGWIVGERDDGAYLYGCAMCAPGDLKMEPHRQLLREEATEEGAVCECGEELAEAEAVDA